MLKRRNSSFFWETSNANSGRTLGAIKGGTRCPSASVALAKAAQCVGKRMRICRLIFAPSATWAAIGPSRTGIFSHLRVKLRRAKGEANPPALRAATTNHRSLLTNHCFGYHGVKGSQSSPLHLDHTGPHIGGWSSATPNK